MKLQLSYAEAQSAVRRLLNLPAEVEICISRKGDGAVAQTDDFASLKPALARLIQFIDSNVAMNKIAAIKELRAQASIQNSGAYFGLKEAKDTVENWDKARPIFFKLGRIPSVSYNAQGIQFL